MPRLPPLELGSGSRGGSGGADPLEVLRQKLERGGGEIDSDEPLVYVGGRWVGRVGAQGSFVEQLAALAGVVSGQAWGHVWQPETGLSLRLSDFVAEFWKMEPHELRRFQEEAFEAGFYGNADRDDIAWGDWDEATLQVWRAMGLRSAGHLSAGRRKSVWDVLADARRAAPAKAKKGPTRQPLVVRLTNPADVRAYASRAAQEVLGRDASDEEVDRYVNLYHAMERQAQQSAYEAGGSGLPGGPGGEVVDVPNPVEFSRSRLREENPQEAAAQGHVERFGQFLQLLRSAGA